MNTDKIYAETIANEYSVKNDSKVVALRKLDAAVKRPPLLFALIFGICMCLVAGVGMCFSLEAIGDGGTLSKAAGIVLGLLGFCGMGVNYPIYGKLLRGRKEKYAGDIIRLASEITGEEEA